ARRVEKRIDEDAVVYAFLPFEPDFAEARKLLRFLQCGVHCQSPRGKPVLVQGARGAEIGGAEKGKPVVILRLLLQAEAGKADIVRERMGGMIRGHVEIALPVKDLARRFAFHDMDVDRLLEISSKMEELHRRAALSVIPERVVLVEGDRLESVVIDFLQDLAMRRSAVLPWLPRHHGGALLEGVEGESMGWPEGELPVLC